MKRFLVPIICLLATILFTVLAFSSLNSGKNFIKTTATISQISSSLDADGEAEHNVEVKYTVDGTEYTALLNEYSSSMSVGKTVDIKYNPDNPNEIVTASATGTIMYFVMAAVALIALVASVLKLMRGR